MTDQCADCKTRQRCDLLEAANTQLRERAEAAELTSAALAAHIIALEGEKHAMNQYEPILTDDQEERIPPGMSVKQWNADAVKVLLNDYDGGDRSEQLRRNMANMITRLETCGQDHDADMLRPYLTSLTACEALHRQRERMEGKG